MIDFFDSVADNPASTNQQNYNSLFDNNDAFSQLSEGVYPQKPLPQTADPFASAMAMQKQIEIQLQETNMMLNNSGYNQQTNFTVSGTNNNPFANIQAGNSGPGPTFTQTFQSATSSTGAPFINATPQTSNVFPPRSGPGISLPLNITPQAVAAASLSIGFNKSGYEYQSSDASEPKGGPIPLRGVTTGFQSRPFVASPSPANAFTSQTQIDPSKSDLNRSQTSWDTTSAAAFNPFASSAAHKSSYTPFAANHSLQQPQVQSQISYNTPNHVQNPFGASLTASQPSYNASNHVQNPFGAGLAASQPAAPFNPFNGQQQQSQQSQVPRTYFEIGSAARGYGYTPDVVSMNVSGNPPFSELPQAGRKVFPTPAPVSGINQNANTHNPFL